MIKAEILINRTLNETRVAVIENGVLQEVHIERPQLKGLAGNIYKGKVVRVLPGMQSAFVDIGLDRAGFLHVADVMPYPDDDASVDLRGPEADIRKWLRQDQELLVQVTKDPVGTKGARLTTHLSIASRHLVFMPDLDHIGVSLRLETETERERLKAELEKILSAENARGYIVRTVAEGIVAADFKQDIDFLQRLWAAITIKAQKALAPSLIHEDLPLIKRVIRDMVNGRVEVVRVDCLEAFQWLLEFANECVPNVAARLQSYQSDKPIFDMYGVEEELQKALDRQVKLKSGGSIVIDQTEAMTTIDVNTGAFVGSSSLEETIFKTNLEAAQTIARQLRLRNIGGIIIIDYIDMTDEEHKAQLYATFAKVLGQDHAKTSISEISALGIVQMTRKRTHDNLLQLLCEPCPLCRGRGRVKTIETLVNEIFREVLRDAMFYDVANAFMILAASEVIQWFQEEGSDRLAELELSIQRSILLKTESNYSREQYDIVMV